MKYRACLAMLTTMVLSSVALAQMPSRFDLSGNLSFGNAQFVSAPNTTGAGQVRAFGWQSSGTSHFNRWLGMTSQFTGGYASADSIQLVGYTGAGTVQHYAMLVGPRITFASRSRIHPFIEGLGGTDYATTKFTSNGTLVNGRELQSAYAIGGGTQINVSRRIGLNVQAHYFETQHSVAFLGWTPSHLQLSAGLVFRLSNLRDRRIIVDQQSAPVPSAPSDGQTASAEPTNVGVQLASPAPVTTMVVTASPETTGQRTVIQRTVQNQFVDEAVAPAPPPQPAIVPAVAKVPPDVAPTPPQPPIAPIVAKVQPVVALPVVKVQPAVVASAVASPAPSRPVPTQAQVQSPQPQQAPPPITRPAVSSSPAAVVTVAQSQQAVPLSLGEYARRLREKKQHQQ